MPTRKRRAGNSQSENRQATDFPACRPLIENKTLRTGSPSSCLQSEQSSTALTFSGRCWRVPSVPLIIGLTQGSMAYGELMHVSGEFSARFLIVALMVTPLMVVFSHHRWPRWLLARRRYLGVAAFRLCGAAHVGLPDRDRRPVDDRQRGRETRHLDRLGRVPVIFLPLVPHQQRRCGARYGAILENPAASGLCRRDIHACALDFHPQQLRRRLGALRPIGGSGGLSDLETQACPPTVPAQ